MNLMIYVLIVYCISIIPSSLGKPNARQDLPRSKEFQSFDTAQEHARQNMCPYLVHKGKPIPIVCWLCQFPHGMQNNQSYVYDCCPGYEKSDIIPGQCFQMESSWRPITSYLEDKGHYQTARVLSSIPAMDSNSSNNVYTVFVPKSDNDINSVTDRSETVAGNLIVQGRYYTNKFINGRSLRNLNNYPLKFTTYSNGMIFLECTLFLSVDHETRNGLVHFTDGVLPMSDRYPTLLSRLNAEPDLSDFVQSLPQDVRTALDQPKSSTWYTVFAPTNSAWSEAVRNMQPGSSIEKLARNHILKKMLCSGAVIEETGQLGPTMAGEYFKMLSDKSIISPCGELIQIIRNDLMSGTGVIQVIDKAMISPEVMSLSDALDCIAQNPKNDVRRSYDLIRQCGLNDGSKATVILLPDENALIPQSNIDHHLYERMKTDEQFKCDVFSYHFLTPTTPGSPDFRQFKQGQSFYTDYRAPNGDQPVVMSNYIHERDGTKMLFNGAITTKAKPTKFKDGVIYTISKLNFPPVQPMIELIQRRSDMSRVGEKLRATNMNDAFKRAGGKVLFLAPIDMGWETRDLENGYDNQQTRNLLQLHTIPYALLGGDNGFIWRATIQTIDTSLTGRNGNPIKLTIKRNPDGNTFIGHNEIPEDQWAMVLEWNLVGTDGIVWVIDWPIKCPHSAC